MATKRFPAFLTAALTIFAMLNASSSASAYQLTQSAWVPSGQSGWNGSWDGVFPSSRTLTNELPSGLEVSIAVSGSVTHASRYYDDSGFMRLDDHGGLASDYISGTTANTPAVAISNFCGSSSTGEASYNCSINTRHSDRGNLTISFSRPVKNPILNLSGIGGYDWRWQGGTSSNPTYENYMRLWTEFELLTPNATLQMLTTNNVFELDSTNKKLAPRDPSIVSSYCHWDAQWDAGCTSLQINGTGTSFTFSLDYNSIAGVSGVNGLTNRTTDDTFIVSVSVQDDYGSAPSSYDPSPTSHTVGDLRLGGGVTADALQSLNASSDPAGDNETNGTFLALGSTPPTFASPGETYSIRFPVSATRSGKVCGWVDWNVNGTFDPDERQCTTFASGSSVQKTLNWVIPVGVTTAPTWLRLRASYDTVGVESASGRLDSGEIEDYNISFAATPPSNSQSGENLASTGFSNSRNMAFGFGMIILGGILAASRLTLRRSQKKH